MAVEVAPALPVQEKGVRLAQVVEEHGPAEDRRGRRGPHRPGRVLPDVIAVVDAPLVKAHRGRYLRQYHAQHVRIGPQDRFRVRAAEDARQLLPDPLRGDVLQEGRAGAKGPVRPRLDGEAQPGGEAQAPEDAQRVLAEALFRLPHRPEEAPLQVLPAAEGVGERPPQVQGHGVDGEVPPGQVLLEGGGELHAVRAAAVGVGPVPAVGGDLHAGDALRLHGDGAVAEARGQGVGGEEGGDLLRQCAGGHVPVAGCAAQEAVAHRAAHAVRLMPRRLQTAEDGLHMFRYPFQAFSLL